VDGPEFDAHAVDFGILIARNAMYREQESRSLKEFEEHREEQVHRCRLVEAEAVVREGGEA
jgi:hypothetical protein